MPEPQHPRQTSTAIDVHECEPELNLRQRAEVRLQSLASAQLATPTPAYELVHELRVHQIELELQNEELRRTQEALEVSRARYFELYDLAPVGYLTLGATGLIEESNLAGAKLLGVPRAALVGRAFSATIQPEDQDGFYQCRQRLFATGQQQTHRLRLLRQNGDTFWVDLKLALAGEQQRTASGTRQHLVILNDISAQMRIDIQRQEIAQRREQFLAMLGHELRNPLAPIRQIADGLRLAPTQDAALIRRAADILVRQAGHLTHLVDDLLDVARIDRGRILLAKQVTDLRESLTSAVEQVQPLLQERRQRLEMMLPPSPVRLDGDPVRLAQVTVNLLRNASDFSPLESPVSLTLTETQDIALVEVRDMGIGIDPELLPRICEPFEQGAPTVAHQYGGLGMGLALAKGLVELHGGSLTATSRGPGQGSTFSVRLPLSDAPVSAAVEDPQSASSSGLQILLIEDHPDVAEACMLVLDLLGERVERVADGPAALAIVERLRPELILLDLGLPGMDGFEVARRLRATPAGRAAWIVAVTGYGQREDIARCETAGFDEHLLKPLGLDALSALLARRHAAAEEVALRE